MSVISRLRRSVSAVLCAALVLGAPGGPAYQAAAQALGRGAAAESAVRPVVGLPTTASGLTAPLTTALPTAFSLSAPAPSLGAVPSFGASALPSASPSAAPAAAPALDARPTAAPAAAASVLPAAVAPAAVPAEAAKTGALETARAAALPSSNGRAPSASAESAFAAASVRFDGAASRSAGEPSTPATSAAATPVRRASGLARFVRAAVLSVGLAVASFAPLHAQTAPTTVPPAAPVVAPAQKNPTPVLPQAAPQAPQAPRPLVASIAVDRADATVGDHVRLTVTLRNPTAKTITVAGLRASLNDALPEDLEIVKADSAEAPLVLAPGETKSVVYEAIPWASGEIAIKGAVVSATVAETAVYPEGIEIALPDSKVVVKSVLTPDWKDKGLRDIVDPRSQTSPYWVWIAGGALGLLLLIGAERLVALKRWYPKLDARRLSLVAETEAEIARLEREAETLDGPAFARATQEAVTRFMVDFAGLPRRERSAGVLARDLKASRAYRAEAVGLAAEIAARAEAARFSGAPVDAAERRRELARLRALVETVAGKAKAEEPKKPAGLNAFAGGAGLQFGSPWALLLFVPYGVYLWKAWQARRAGARFAVSSEAHASSHRSWRERLAGLPRAARLGAIALIILALARPMIGVQRLESYTPSTDTMIVEDKSGSMDEKMGDGSKLDAAAVAIRAYVDEQRKGTQNRVGMETFDDKPYVDVRLTTDYDALISHLKEIKSGGSTAIGEGILTAVGHFAEVNMMDLDEAKDARIAPMKKLLREQGLGAALEYAKAYPDLMDQVLRPDRAKVIVLFTDGESNTGIDPSDAAKIAASLGVKVYTVGVGDSFDEKTLQAVSSITKAQFFKAGDAERMREVLLEISRLEKSPTKIVSSVAVKDYTALLALFAFVLLGAEAALGSTRLRALQAMILALSLQNAPISPSLWTAPMAQVTATAPADDAARAQKVPAEMAEGNRLYAQGRYDEAVKKYAEAVAAHPELPSLYFSMGDAYLRLGDVDRAMQSYQKYLDLTKDPAEQSRTLFNMGDAMLRRQDAQKAMEFYKEALRRDPTNQDAKWNLEALKKQQQEQQKDQQQQQGKGKGKKGQKGQQGQPGNQPGQPGNQKGQPQQSQSGNQQGQPSDASKDPKGDKQKGAEQLTRSLGDQQKKGDEEARKAITRSGSGVWATLALPLAGLAGHGIAFTSPLILAVVAVGVPLAALLLWYGLRRGVKSAQELSPGTAPKSARSWWGFRRWARKTALAVAALGLVGLAATDPRGGATDERVNFGGKDMIVAVDGSYSFVYAEDGRMTQAKKELADFAERLQGTDRIGLVVFAGEGRTASPISIDYGNFEYKVNRLELESRGLKEGSDLGKSVKFAAESFDNAKKIGDRARVLIVISDGEAFDSEIDAAIKAAKDHGVTIYAIGMGSESGTRMKIPTVDGKGTEYLMDSKTGQPAVSHLEEGKLRRLAESTGGAYFRAGKGASIQRVMEAVAHLEKGRQGDTIKSPRPIGTYLLWPALALLLLDLLLPGSSLLRRDAPKAPADDKKKKDGTGAGLMGAALVPLAAWPQILPFALIGTVVVAFLALDRWKDGALTRGIKEAWQRRQGFVAKGVRADLGLLFDLREADAPRVDAFVARWQSAPDKERPALIAAAASDDALWREKLVAAYLSGSGPETHEAVMTALRRASRERLEPLTPVVARAAARAGSLAWLDHSDARERLEFLQDAASSQPLPFPIPSAPRRAGRFARLGRIALTSLLALNMLVSGLSIDGTVRYAREQAAAEQVAFRIFYGDDLFVFTDRYVDERIPEIVLPALRDWHRSPSDAGPALERALQVLRESPDPKADNVLVAAFRRAPLLPMTATAETTLLKALIERDSDALWASLDKTIAQSGDDPAQAALLLKLVALGVQEGSEHSFVNLFRVLKSPNDEVRGKAFEMLYGAMTAPDAKTPFLTRLTAVDAKFASDPTLQVWNEIFALRRLSAKDAAALDAAQVRAFFDQLLKNAQADDAARAPAFAQAIAQLQADPNAKPETPPSTLATAFQMLDGFEKRAQGADSAVAVPAELAGVARYAVNTQVTELIKAAEARFPGLHEKLIADGVVLPDEQSSSSGYYDEYEGRGWYGGRGSYGSSTTQNYREFYKLSHLRTLKADIDAAAKGATFDDLAKAAAATELVDRADAALDQALSAGARAGMMEGGSAAEKTAEALLPVLRDGAKAFTGDSFLQILRAKGLAPSVGDASSALAYPEALSPAQLSDLRGVFAAMAATGKVPDGSRALTWAEKQFVARGLDAVDAQVDPKAAPATGFARAGQDGIALARLAASIDAAGKDGDALLKLEKDLIARLKGPAAATADAGDLGQVLPQLLKALDAAGRGAEGWALIRSAVDAKALPPAALEALRPQAFASFKDLADKLETAFADQGAKQAMLDADIRFTDSEWRTEFKLRHYDALLAAARRYAPQAKTEDQKKAIAAVEKSVPELKAFARELGVSAGDAPGELQTVNLNKALHAAWVKFPGQTFVNALRAEGLAVKGDSYDKQTSWLGSYSKADALRLKASLEAKLKAGTWNDGTATRALTDDEKDLLKAAIARVDQLIAAQAAAPSATQSLHALAPMAVLMLASALGSWTVAAIVAAAATWLIWKYAFREAPLAGPDAEEKAAAAEARRARVAFAAKRMADSVVGGSFRSRFVGAGGSDFAEARPYQDEDYREIDWKTSAKKGEIYAKKFELEKDMPLMLVIDVSRSGRFGTRGHDKRAVIDDAAAMLALAAARSNVRVGAILFSDRVETVIPPRGGLKHAERIVEALYGAEPVGKGTDLTPALESLGAALKSRAMVAVVSDFLAPDFKDALAATAARHDLRAIRVIDPAETKPLPDVGLLPLVDAESGATRTLDTGSGRVRREAASAISRREAKIADDLLAARARPIFLTTDGEPLETLAQHFDPKARNAP